MSKDNAGERTFRMFSEAYAKAWTPKASSIAMAITKASAPKLSTPIAPAPTDNATRKDPELAREAVMRAPADTYAR